MEPKASEEFMCETNMQRYSCRANANKCMSTNINIFKNKIVCSHLGLVIYLGLSLCIDLPVEKTVLSSRALS